MDCEVGGDELRGRARAIAGRGRAGSRGNDGGGRRPAAPAPSGSGQTKRWLNSAARSSIASPVAMRPAEVNRPCA